MHACGRLTAEVSDIFVLESYHFMNKFFAYVDPGSGLMLVQILTAVFCGFALSLNKIRDWFKKIWCGDKK